MRESGSIFSSIMGYNDIGHNGITHFLGLFVEDELIHVQTEHYLACSNTYQLFSSSLT